jgi:hypothetical protein
MNRRKARGEVERRAEDDLSALVLTFEKRLGISL